MYESPLCQCGCGQALSGRRTKWATDKCGARSRADKDKVTERTSLLSKRYNLSPDDYEKIDRYQGNKCAICGKPNSTKRHHSVDHDHKTFLVRGLLCFRCNAYLLGNLSVEQVRAILEYLESPPAVRALGYEVIANPESNKRRKRRRQPRKKDRRKL